MLERNLIATENALYNIIIEHTITDDQCDRLKIDIDMVVGKVVKINQLLCHKIISKNLIDLGWSNFTLRLVDKISNMKFEEYVR